MANTFKNAWSDNVSNASATPTTVLNCPSGNSSRCILIGVQLSNTTSSEITATVVLFDQSETSSNILVKDAVLPSASMLDVLAGSKVILEEQDQVRVYSNTASACNTFVNYLLVDTT